MHTLAVRQPWATHIAEGSKTIEVRRWRTEYRGPLLIAASGRPISIENDQGEQETLKTQCLVCIVDLIDCRPWLREDIKAACLEEWDTGYWGWHLANARHVWPAAHKGKLRIYDTPDDQIFLLPMDAHYLDAGSPQHCMRCAYPPGPDWLDGASTCPHCRLVQPA